MIPVFCDLSKSMDKKPYSCDIYLLDQRIILIYLYQYLQAILDDRKFSLTILWIDRCYDIASEYFYDDFIVCYENMGSFFNKTCIYDVFSSLCNAIFIEI